MIAAIEARASIRPLNIAGGVQLTLQDYPTEAVRELVVNAFAHRDYEVEGAVDVEQSSEQLRISSPGPLVFGVTVDNILSHPSTPRNRLLLETITTLQVAERTGQGVDRACRVLLRNGKKPPTFVDTGTSVDVSLAGGAGDDHFVRYVNTSLPEAMAADIDVLLTLDTLCTRRTITAAVAAPIIQRSAVTAQATLERLSATGIVEPSRRTASASFPSYRLTNEAMTALGRAVAYHRRVADGLDDKIVEHVRGIVTKDDGKARGPGVRYSPGPAFPGGPR